MEKGYFKVTIQTKPYLKKYLQKLYGNPVKFTISNDFGNCLSAVVFRPEGTLTYRTRLTKEELRMRVDTFDTMLDIYFSKSYLTENLNGFDITDRHVIALNRMFDSKFSEELWRMCTYMHLMGAENKEALQYVCDGYGIQIEEDITFDTLKKKEYRFRQKMQEKDDDLSREVVKNNIRQIVFSNMFAARV